MVIAKEWFPIEGAGVKPVLSGAEGPLTSFIMFLQVIAPHHIPAGERLSDVLSWEIDLSPGEFDLIAVSVGIDLNGEGIRLRTPPLRITVE